MLSTTATQINSVEENLKLVTTEISHMLEQGTLCPVDSKAYFHITALIANASKQIDS